MAGFLTRTEALRSSLLLLPQKITNLHVECKKKKILKRLKTSIMFVERKYSQILWTVL